MKKKCFLTPTQSYKNFSEDCIRIVPGKINVLIYGDSLAAHYFPGLSNIAGSLNLSVSQLTSSACPPLFDYVSDIRPHCRDINNYIRQQIKNLPFDVVIITGAWNENAVKMGKNELLERLENTLSVLSQEKEKILLIGPGIEYDQPPSSIDFNRNLFQKIILEFFHLADVNSPLSDVSPTGAEIIKLDAMFNEKFSPAYKYVSVLGALCSHHQCPHTDFEGRFLTWDQHHLSVEGSQFVVRQAIEPRLQELIKHVVK